MLIAYHSSMIHRHLPWLGSNCKAWSSPALLGTALLLDWRHKFEFEEPTCDPLIQTAPNRSFATTASKQPPTSFPRVGRGGFFLGRPKVLQKSTSDKSSNRAMKNQPLFIFSSLSLSPIFRGIYQERISIQATVHSQQQQQHPGKRLVLPSDVFACQAQAETSDATGSSAVIVELQSRRNSLSLQDHTADGKKTCTTWDVQNPMKHGTFWLVFGFLPSTGKTPSGKWWPFPRTKFPFANWVIFHCQSGNETNLLRSWEPPEKIYSNAIRSLLGAPGFGSPLQGHIIGFLWFPAKDVYLLTSDVFSKWKHAKMAVKLFLKTTFCSSIQFVFLALLQDLLLRGKAATPKIVRYIEWCKLGMCKLAWL